MFLLNADGTVTLAGAADLDVGALDGRVLATDKRATVRLTTAQGTQKMVANGAIAAGSKVFTAAAGKVGPTAPGSFVRGIAMTAAAADGDVIEVLPLHGTIAQ